MGGCEMLPVLDFFCTGRYLGGILVLNFVRRDPRRSDPPDALYLSAEMEPCTAL